VSSYCPAILPPDIPSTLNTHTVGRRGGQEEEQEQGAPYSSRTSALAIQQVQRERERKKERRESKRERETHNTKIDVFFFRLQDTIEGGSQEAGQVALAISRALAHSS
jgi:hypothetical protein